MTRLSLADEENYAHTSFKLSAAGTIIFATSLLLTAVALSYVNNSIEPWEGNNDTITRYMIENMEVLRNGSYSYNFTNPQTGIIDAGIIDSWFENIIEGKHRYDYGNTFNNFCWNREQVPTEEWMPSLFRSTQLFIIVQVPIRIALLLAITYRLFLICVALRYKILMDSTKLIEVLKPLFLFTEILHNIATYLFYTLHIWQDLKYKHYIRVTVALSLISFTSKMVTTNLLKTNPVSTIIRGVFAAITVLIASDIMNNVSSAIMAMNCDQMVPPNVALCEYIFLLMILINYAMDILDASSIHLCVSCSKEDAMDYRRLKMEREAALLRKNKL